MVEWWWNGAEGSEPGDDLRRDVRLCTDDESWWIEIRVGGPEGESMTSDEGNERYARRLLASAVDGDDWRRVA